MKLEVGKIYKWNISKKISLIVYVKRLDEFGCVLFDGGQVKIDIDHIDETEFEELPEHQTIAENLEKFFKLTEGQ